MNRSRAPSRRRRYVKLTLEVAVAAALLFFMGRFLLQRWGEVSPSLKSARIERLLVSVVVLLPALLLSGLGWHLVLRLLGQRPPALRSVRIFLWSQLAKYLPGHVWHFVGRVYLSRRLQVEAPTSIVSLYVESVLVVVSAAIMTATGLTWEDLPFRGRWVIGVVLLPLFLAMLHPAALAMVLRLWRKPRPEGAMYSWCRAYALVPVYTLIWIGHGVAFTIFVSAFSPVGPDMFLPLTAALAASFVAGFLTPFAPGGIGVREGVLSVLLAQVVTAPMAVLLALASRLWFVVCEVISVLVVSLLPGPRRRPRGGGGA